MKTLFAISAAFKYVGTSRTPSLVSQQGQGVKKLRLVVLRISLGQLLHRRGVLRVPFALVGLAAVQDFHRAHIGPFARIGNTAGAFFRSGAELGQRSLTRSYIHLVPDPMIEGHRLSPISHRKSGVGRFGGNK